MTADRLAALPAIPRDADGPVFHEPWEAQAFALAVRLHEACLFGWDEWAVALGAEIKAAQAAGDPDTGETYYRHWLAALEKLVAAKGAVTDAELADRKAAWDRAARATPHGEPIVLGRELQAP
ncbi:nitrile hydratase accessory protein [Prosthecomicrobium hirschii]|uniref:nitrile hydratase accessory protein n=1 Tax=Prosthecodimorpha hirschii TaxID=665126 RepID=UPI00221F4437|nr:nitrile hydratase accessory protein [Prosthecomicrobium hirschii]